jgi:hypothetical protein
MVLVLAGLVLYVTIGRKRASCGFPPGQLRTAIGDGRLGEGDRLPSDP